MANVLRPEKRAEVKRLLLAGGSIRAIAEHVGCAKNTVKRYAQFFEARPACPCGQPTGHRGWCAWRYQFSPARRGWMQRHWERRGDSDIAQAIDQAADAVRQKRHDVPRWLWCSAFTMSLATGKCRVCGATGSVGYQAQLHGPVFRDECLNETEVVARWAAQQEQRWQRQHTNQLKQEHRPWLDGKHALAATRKWLKEASRDASASPKPASRPGPTSRP